MQMFLLNIVLAVVYLILSGSLSPSNLVVGFVIGFVIVSIYAQVAGQASYAVKGLRFAGFVWYFIRILIKANLQVAWEVITPGFQMRPRIIRYPVEDLTLVQMTTLANAITLTPGTLSADIDEQARCLYIHCMYAEDRAAVISDLDELKREMLRGIFGSDT